MELIQRTAGCPRVKGQFLAIRLKQDTERQYALAGGMAGGLCEGGRPPSAAEGGNRAGLPARRA